MTKLVVNQGLWLLLALSILLSAGCVGKDASEQLNTPGPLSTLAGLPALPQDAAGARQSAAAQSTLQTGDQAFAKSGGAQVQSPQLVLPAAANSLQWAYYQFNVGTAATLTDIQVHFTMDAGTKTWIGLSNYTENHWDLSGPFSATQDVMLNTGPDYISSAGNFYVLVAAYDLNTTRLQELFLTYDESIALYSISGVVTTAAFNPVPGASINVQPGDLIITPGPTGVYSIPGLAPGAYDLTPSAAGYTFNPQVLNVPVLNADVTGQDFVGSFQAPTVTYVDDARPFLVTNCAGCHPAQTPLTVFAPEAYDSAMSELAAIKTNVQNDHNGSYSAADKTMIAAWVDAGGPLGATATHYTDVRSQIFSANCMGCHSSTLSGGGRNGAPMDVNFDTYAAASGYRSGGQSVAKRGNTRVQGGTMPPSGTLSPALKALFQAWIDSGWPN